MGQKDPPEDLQGVREGIEGIDRQILALFRDRMDLVEQVAGAKIRNAWPFRDPRREDQVLQRVRRVATELGLDAHHMEHLYRGIMNMAVAHQQTFLQQLDTTPLRVAYQGVEGAYSHLAAREHYKGRAGGALLTGFESFHEAAQSVRDGSSDVALLPIENSTAGSINETYDALTEGGLAITAERVYQVSHCLLALPGATLEGLREVLSHPQALRQCAKFLRSLPGAVPVEVFDTSGAARKVRAGGDLSRAAIASEAAGQRAGLEPLLRDIQDQAFNYTRFVEVAREETNCPADRPCKSSLLIETGNRPGELGEVLRIFSDRSINLSKIESRPVPEQPFHYRFYLDVEGHHSAPPLAEALSMVKELAAGLRILGSYPCCTAVNEANDRTEEKATGESGEPRG